MNDRQQVAKTPVGMAIYAGKKGSPMSLEKLKVVMEELTDPAELGFESSDQRERLGGLGGLAEAIYLEPVCRDC